MLDQLIDGQNGVPKLDYSGPLVVNAQSGAGCLVVCEHASPYIPAPFENLGLDPSDYHAHIVWDIGAERLARAIAENLNAVLVLQTISRLVYDCNRPLREPSAIPDKSEVFLIPGNQNLPEEHRRWRYDQFYLPFEEQIENQLNLLEKKAGESGGLKPRLVTIHSFTPIYHGRPREVEIGLVCDQDDTMAKSLLKLIDQGEYAIDINHPYGPEDGVTHTLKRHGISRGIDHVMIEVRNDLLEDENHFDAISQLLSRGLKTLMNQTQNHEGGHG